MGVCKTQIMERISAVMDPEQFTAWLAPCRLVGVSNISLTLAVPTEFFAGWIASSYGELILAACGLAGGELAFVIDKTWLDAA